MEKHKLEYYRQLLEYEEEQLLKTIEGFEEQGIHENMNDVTGELSAYDQHPADYGSQMFEREKDYGLLENAKQQLSLVREALHRIDEGTYGYCEKCQQPIDPERLAALPYAVKCIYCKQEEEQHLTPDASDQNLSFGRTFTHGDFVGFDGEDAWQAVARYGTANSPQDIPGASDFDEAYTNADEDLSNVDDIKKIQNLHYDKP